MGGIDCASWKIKKDLWINEPIFTSEILEIMKDYSRQRVYQLIENAEKNGTLVRYGNGIYYMPKETEFGRSSLSVNSIVDKKYVKYKGNTFGIYGKYVIDLNFLVSYQVPNAIEIITNNESRKLREIKIRGRRVVLRKSRVPITNENVDAYTLMELFNNMDMNRYQNEIQIKSSVINYVRDKKIKKKDILNLANAFPAKAMKNIAISGITGELA